MKFQVLIGFLFFGLLFLFSGNVKAQISDATPTSPDKTEAEIIQHGKYMFDLAGCVHCHTADKTKPLAGGYKLDSQFGTFYTPNITMDIKTGIGTWTESQFLKAMRQGISPKGEYYYPSFPFTNYTKLTDEDILAMFKYLKTLPAVELANKTHVVLFPLNQRKLMIFWRALNFRKWIDTDVDDYSKVQGVYIPQPDKSASWNRGAYLVDGAMHCTQCHTPHNRLGGLITKKWMSGAFLFGEERPAPNLTADADSDIANWTTNDWKTFLKQGVTADGNVVGGTMSKIVKVGTSKLTAADSDAVTEYFQSLPPIKSNIPKMQP